MPSINLLPWREAERKKRQRDFGVAAAGAVVAAIAALSNVETIMEILVSTLRIHALRG